MQQILTSKCVTVEYISAALRVSMRREAIPAIIK